MGRWTEAEFCGKWGRHVVIITAYQVCKQSVGTAGPTTAFMQQWTMLKQINPGQEVNPREALLRDLSNRVKALVTDGKEIIIVMDANDTLQRPNTELAKFVRELQLIDILVEKHGTDNEPATYAYGSERIDYLLTTRIISEYIIACGILPLQDICVSDHRPIYADIDLTSYLGGKLPDCLSKSSRGVHSSDPRTVTKYQKLMKIQMEKHQLLEKSNAVTEIINKKEYDNKEVCEALEQIDNILTTIKQKCEEESKNKHHLPWSPKLRNAYNNKQFWSLWMAQSRSGKNLSEFREKYINDETRPYANIASNDTKTIRRKFKDSIKALSDYQLQSRELRDEFLKEQAEMAIDGGNQELQKIILNIKRSEERRRIFAKLKRLKGNRSNSGINHILVDTPEGERIAIHEPDLVFEALLQHNTKHFSQADGTPFTQEPLKSLIGPYGTSTFAQELLQGKIDLDCLNLHEATNAILLQLQKCITNESISDTITTEDVIKGYEKWSEKTSTSPSGLHLGLDKAMLKYRNQQTTQAEKDNDIPLFKKYFMVKAALLNNALQTGHIYTRWKKVVNALIEKLPGTPLLTKLRVIHLIESDFNLMIGILWGRRLIWAGEDNNAFNDGQGGSRPGRTTQELTLTKHLQYSILRTSKTNGSSFDNDAKSCFDRIVMPLVSLGSQQLGMPPRACELFLKTLEQIKYHVKTNHGISEQYYHTTDDHTIHGPGQGGRGSPSAWVVVSSLIMHCMKEKSTGCTIQNPYNKKDKFTYWITGFVDDVTHWCANPAIQSQEDLVDQLQTISQWWEQLLFATGGKLELSKCFFYIIQWEFDTEGIAYMNPPSSFSTKVKLTDSITNAEVIIPQRDCSDPHKTLGVMECPSGDNKHEYKRIMEKSNKCIQKLISTTITKSEANTYYFTTYLPSVTYGFCIGTLYKNQLEKIQINATAQFLNCMGYSSKIPRQIAFGSRSIGGIGLRNLFAEQGTEKTLSIIRYLRCERPVSNIIRQSINWFQVVAGTSKSVLEDVHSCMPQLDGEHWILSLREFLSKSHVTIKINDFPINKKQCWNDTYIMDIATNSKFSDTQLQQINRCRIYLHATTMSDISTADGSSVSLVSYNCDQKGIIQDDTVWPVQPRPGKAHITCWKKFITTLCHTDSLKLDRPLEKWDTDIQIRHQVHQHTFINENQQLAFTKINNIWHHSNIKSYRRYWKTSDEWAITTFVPSNLIPADYDSKYPDRFRWRTRETTITDMEVDKSNDELLDWEKYKSNLSEWVQFMIFHIETEPDDQTMRQILQNSNESILCASDGSLKDGTGTYAWIISIEREILASGYGITPGQPISSQRSEACGKLSWLLWLKHYSIFHNIQINCTVLSYCDNKSVVNKTKRHLDYNRPSCAITPNFDIFKTIYITQQFFRTQSLQNTEWIKSHQDNDQSLDQLSTPAYLNALADNMTKEAFTLMDEQCNIIFPAGSVYLACDNMVLSGNENTKLKWRWSEFELQDYYVERMKITKEELFHINWAGLNIARSKITSSEQDFSIKHLIGWLPVGKKLKQRGQTITECPPCKGDNESIDHLWQCTARTIQNELTVLEFSTFLQSKDTDPTITTIFIQEIKKWFHIQHDDNSDTNFSYQQANILQTKIGWGLVLRGVIIQQWSAIQEQWFLQHGKSTLGDTWSAAISKWWIQKSYNIWKCRNEYIHNTLLVKETRTELETLEQVRRLYVISDQLSTNDKEPFQVSLSDRLRQPWRTLKTWVQITAPIVDTCLQAYSEQLIRTNNNIRSLISRNNQLNNPVTVHTVTINSPIQNLTQTNTSPIIDQTINTNTIHENQAPSRNRISITRNIRNETISISEENQIPIRNSANITDITHHLRNKTSQSPPRCCEDQAGL